MANLAKKAPESLNRGHTYCPGCGHGLFIRILHEVMEEKGLADNNICQNGVGCSGTYHLGGPKYSACNGGNVFEGHHGRAPVSARAIKAMLPDTFVWTYQGDGDAYAIGMGETMLAAHNNYPITVFVINNCNYGMTGGQYAPTTLIGQKTTTTPSGNQARPFDFMKHTAVMDQVMYAARGTTATPAEIRKLKAYMSKAIDVQMKYNNYSIIEILSPCPTNWQKAPVDANKWIMEEVTKSFPLGEFRTY